MALNAAKKGNTPSLLARLRSGVKSALTGQGDSSASGIPKTLLVFFLIAAAVALLNLLFNITQVERDNRFSILSGDVQVFVQQAARDAVLATHSREAASVRLVNVMGSVESDLKQMRKLEADTLFRQEVVPALNKLEASWQQLHNSLKTLSPGVLADEANKAQLISIVNTSDEIVATARRMVDQYKQQGRANLFLILSVLSGLLALLMLIVVGYRQVLSARRQFLEIEQTNLGNQEAILHLLDEMGDLADGDLTVKAQVSENITGAIADSIKPA